MNGAHIGVYAGTFDPPTNGHLYMIETGRKLFDRFIVAIGENPDKKPLFTLEERLEMLRAITHGMEGVEVDSFPFMAVVNYARQKGVQFVLRGIRGPKDFEYEMDMRNFNAEQAPGIETVFLMPPEGLVKVSSSSIKGFMKLPDWENWCKGHVPAPVLDAIRRKKEGEKNHGRCI